MPRPGDYACQRVDDVCIAADRLLIAVEDGGYLRDGYAQQLARAIETISRAHSIHQARIAKEDRRAA